MLMVFHATHHYIDLTADAGHLQYLVAERPARCGDAADWAPRIEQHRQERNLQQARHEHRNPYRTRYGALILNEKAAITGDTPYAKALQFLRRLDNVGLCFLVCGKHAI